MVVGYRSRKRNDQSERNSRRHAHIDGSLWLAQCRRYLSMTDLSVGGFDPLIEAALRGTFAAASAVTAATFTTLTPAVTTGNSGTFTAAAGSFITQGFRVGQVVRRTGSAIAANNGRNLRVTGVTAGLLTFTTSDGLPITGWRSRCDWLARHPEASHSGKSCCAPQLHIRRVRR
jgi:hypothetical protein